MPTTAPLIELKDVHKHFMVGAQEVQILKGVSFTIEQGDFVILLGPSGCGKSTILHLLLGLENPSQGKVLIEGDDFYASGIEDDRSNYRKHNIGMIFQKPNWIQALNVMDNVMFPLTLLNEDKVLAITKANQALDTVGMLQWATYSPTELSSGQQQKVSLARSIITNPKTIVADEPTGNLDYESGKALMELMVTLNNQGRTVIMVTHDLEYLKYAKTAIQVFNGSILGVFRGKEKEALSKGIKFKRGVDTDKAVGSKSSAGNSSAATSPTAKVKEDAAVSSGSLLRQQSSIKTSGLPSLTDTAKPESKAKTKEAS